MSICTLIRFTALERLSLSPDPFTYDNHYGSIVNHTKTVETNNPYAYTGRELDTNELYYYRARYYDPMLQRFLGEDPIGFDGGDSNFYSYVKNSPVNLIDPTGLFDMDCYAKCIEKKRWDLWKYLIPFTPVPKKYVPPFRVPYPNQPWTTPYSVGLYGAGKAGVPKSITGPLRRGGRVIAPAVLIVDGVHDWYLIVDCALDCKDNECN